MGKIYQKKVMLFIPFLALAGAEVMVGDLAEGLIDKKCRVIVVSFYDYHSAITERLEQLNIPVIYLGKTAGLDLKMFIKISKLIREEKPDVIHTHLNVVKYVMPCAIMHRVKRRIHTVHNLADKEQGKIDRKITKFFVRFYNLKLIGISPKIKESIVQEYKLSEEQVGMVFNGRKLENFKLKNSYEMKNKLKILHVGRFSQQKNHEMLLNSFAKAVEEYPNMHLSMVGEGELLDNIKLLAQKLNLTDKVEFLGIRLNVGDLMKDSDVFVLPSKYEGMPITLIEAMASGMPIIATNVGGIPDMLENNVNALLVNKSEQCLKNAFIKMASSVSLRKRLGIKAYLNSQSFSHSMMAEKYLEIYSEGGTFREG